MPSDQYEQGILTSVEENPLGDELLADAPQTVRTNLDTDPRALVVTGWTIQAGTGSTVTATNEVNQLDGPSGITSYRKGVVATGPQTAGSSGTRRNLVIPAGVTGDTLRLGYWYSTSKTILGTFYTRLRLGGAGGTVVTTTTTGPTVNANTWTWLEGIVVATGAYDTVEIWFAPNVAGYQQVGDVLKFTACMIERGPGVTLTGDYFDGDTPSTPGVTHAWTGTAQASASTKTTGTSTLYLTDAVDFDEDGGRAQVWAEVFAYSVADLEADALTLVEPLGASYLAGDPVFVVPRSMERRALVQVEDEGEGVDARVPHALYDRLSLGSRDAAGEWVTLSLDGAEWVVHDVLARDPIVDGSFLDPDTVPPPSTDNLPPSSSPTPTVIGGIGAIFARWVAPANADPVTYDVHISPTSGFTPSASTLVVTSPATSITVRKLPTPVGAPTPTDVLQYGVRYYVRIVARDADGAAAAGVEGSDVMVQVNSPDIAANSIFANHIVANQITGDLLAANIVLASKITTGSIDANGNIVGQRVEMDPTGFQVITAAGVPVVSLPTDPGQASRFDGEVVARGLTVTGPAEFRSATNISGGSTVTLASSAADPSLAPTLSVDWASATLTRVKRSSNPGPDFGLGSFALDPLQITAICESATAGVYYVAQAVPDEYGGPGYSNGTRVWFYNTSGANVQIGGLYFKDYTADNIYGLTFKGGKLYGLRQTGTGWLVFDDTLDPDASSPSWGNFYAPLNTSQYPALGNDGTNLIIAENDPTGVLKVRTLGAWASTGATSGTYGWPPVVISSTTTYGAGTDTLYSNCYVGKGNFDFGASKVVVGKRASGGNCFIMNSASGSTRDSTLEFPPGTSNRRGMMYMGGVFYTMGGDGVLRTHSSLSLADGLVNWWAAVTWRDTVGTLHETKAGPLSSLTMVRRARMKVTSPGVPAIGGGVDDPNAWALYMTKVAAGTPATTALHYQVAQFANSLTYTVGDVAMASAAPPTSNNFAGAGQVGVVQSQATRIDGSPKIYMDGTGRANVDGLIPAGTIVMTAVSGGAPFGWFLCVGQAISRTLYADLFAAIGTTYGVGDGSTTFNLPNLKGRVPVGLDAASSEFTAMGVTGGEKAHTLAASELPAHTHPGSSNSTGAHTHDHPSGGFYISTAGAANIASGSSTNRQVYTDTGSAGAHSHTVTVSANTGGGGSANVLQPYLVLNYLIKA